MNAPYIYNNVVRYFDEPEYIDPLYGIMHLDTDVLAVISELLNLGGPNYAIGGACASGNLALLNALDTLPRRTRRPDRCVRRTLADRAGDPARMVNDPGALDSLIQSYA